MIRMEALHIALGFAVLSLAALLVPAPALAQNQHMEVIHHPNYEPGHPSSRTAQAFLRKRPGGWRAMRAGW